MPPPGTKEINLAMWLQWLMVLGFTAAVVTMIWIAYRHFKLQEQQRLEAIRKRKALYNNKMEFQQWALTEAKSVPPGGTLTMAGAVNEYKTLPEAAITFDSVTGIFTFHKSGFYLLEQSYFIREVGYPYYIFWTWTHASDGSSEDIQLQYENERSSAMTWKQLFQCGDTVQPKFQNINEAGTLNTDGSAPEFYSRCGVVFEQSYKAPAATCLDPESDCDE